MGSVEGACTSHQRLMIVFLDFGLFQGRSSGLILKGSSNMYPI